MNKATFDTFVEKGGTLNYQFIPRGVCSRSMELSLDENDVITELSIKGGCEGNLQGIVSLVIGQKAQEVAGRLQGIRCGSRGTSCPDQLAAAILQALEAKKTNDYEA